MSPPSPAPSSATNEGVMPYAVPHLPQDDGPTHGDDRAQNSPSDGKTAPRPFPPVPTDEEVKTAGECFYTAIIQLRDGEQTYRLSLIDHQGDPHHLDVTESALRFLKEILLVTKGGKVAYLDTTPAVLTFDEAARILGHSHAHLDELLDEGEIPFSGTGAQRRMHYRDVMNYRMKLKAERRKALDELVRIGQELGCYG